MKYFLSAGEASGDLHASQLMARLREADPSAEFSFLGGDLMAGVAGHTPVIHYRDMAYMGFVDVLLNLRKVLGNLSAAKESLAAMKPDCLILVDYPSFNLRLARYARELGIKVFYYISPKVWAWKEYRVKEIRKLVDRMFCILPFEPDFYRRHDYEVEYVGNPTREEMDAVKRSLPGCKEFLTSHGLPDTPYVALVPGSRVSEIKANLPVMVEALKGNTGYKPVIAAAPAIDAGLYERFAPGIPRVEGFTHQLVAYASAALVTSGTATLETAVLGTPQVVAYRAVASRLVYNFFKHILKVKFVSLPNLIMDREIVTELLLHQCTPENLRRELERVLPGGDRHEEQLADYAGLYRRLGTSNASETTAAEIVKRIS